MFAPLITETALHTFPHSTSTVATCKVTPSHTKVSLPPPCKTTQKIPHGPIPPRIRHSSLLALMRARHAPQQGSSGLSHA